MRYRRQISDRDGFRRRWRIRAWVGAVSLCGVLAPAAASAARPMSYLQGFGQKAYPVVSLTWALLGISSAVVFIIAGLVLAGAWIQRTRGPVAIGERLPVGRSGHGLRWIYIGVGISFVVILGSMVWTLVTLSAVERPHGDPDLTIQITGYQWWWKAQYLSKDASRVLITANEIHIPTGQPVRIQLIGGDVIHSFWIPLLSGKTDTIPGQINDMWLEADKPGRYRGQCTEYCGWQHAHMAMYMIAQPPAEFKAWWNAQLQPAPPPSTPKLVSGEKKFVFHCGTCHTIRGTDAGGTVAPDLTHLMSRSTIGAGTLPNTVAALSGWIANSQAIKPGNHMPVLYLSGPDLDDIRGFLKTLK